MYMSMYHQHYCSPTEPWLCVRCTPLEPVHPRYSLLQYCISNTTPLNTQLSMPALAIHTLRPYRCFVTRPLLHMYAPGSARASTSARCHWHCSTRLTSSSDSPVTCSYHTQRSLRKASSPRHSAKWFPNKRAKPMLPSRCQVIVRDQNREKSSVNSYTTRGHRLVTGQRPRISRPSRWGVSHSRGLGRTSVNTALDFSWCASISGRDGPWGLYVWDHQCTRVRRTSA